MKIAISAPDSRDNALLSQMKTTLESLNINIELMRDSNHKLANEVDLVLAAGGIEVFLITFTKS